MQISSIHLNKISFKHCTMHPLPKAKSLLSLLPLPLPSSNYPQPPFPLATTTLLFVSMCYVFFPYSCHLHSSSPPTPFTSNSCQFLRNLNMQLTYNLPIVVLGIYLREIKTFVYSKNCTPILFIVSLFIIASTENNPDNIQLVNG